MDFNSNLLRHISSWEIKEEGFYIIDVWCNNVTVLYKLCSPDSVFRNCKPFHSPRVQLIHSHVGVYSTTGVCAAYTHASCWTSHGSRNITTFWLWWLCWWWVPQIQTAYYFTYHSLQEQTTATQRWMRVSTEHLQSCLECTDWDGFRQTLTSLDEYTDTMSPYISFSKDTCIPNPNKIVNQFQLLTNKKKQNNKAQWLQASCSELCGY